MKKNLTYKEPVLWVDNINGTFASLVIKAINNGTSDCVNQININERQLLTILACCHNSNQIWIEILVEYTAITKNFAMWVNAIVWMLGTNDLSDFVLNDNTP